MPPDPVGTLSVTKDIIMFSEATNHLAGGISCHQWNIYIDGLWSVFKSKKSKS